MFIKLTSNTDYYKNSNICYSDECKKPMIHYIAIAHITAISASEFSGTKIAVGTGSYHVTETIEQIWQLIYSK